MQREKTQELFLILSSPKAMFGQAAGKVNNQKELVLSKSYGAEVTLSHSRMSGRGVFWHYQHNALMQGIHSLAIRQTDLS